MARKAAKRKPGRKAGVKVGPYKMNLSQMMAQIKELRKEVDKLKKVLN